MQVEGRIWKDGSFWLVELPALDAMTQGKTRKEALLMIEDLVFEMAKSHFPRTKLSVDLDCKKDRIGVTLNDPKLLLALLLRRQREKSNSTLREAAERLGSNAYAQYERGKASPTLEKFEELLRAANPSEPLRLTIA